MSWTLKRKAQQLLAGEEGAIRKDWGGRTSVALVYPNTYAVGMSNLGFQAIYSHLNAIPDVVCERVFFPDPEDLDEQLRTETAPFSLESLRPLADFDLIGFSVTYEGDYINLVRMLRLAGLPPRAVDRGPGHPVILMGGVCARFRARVRKAPDLHSAVADVDRNQTGRLRILHIEPWRFQGR